MKKPKLRKESQHSSGITQQTILKMPTHTQLEKHAQIKYNYTGNVKRLSIKEQEDNKKSLNLLKLQRF